MTTHSCEWFLRGLQNTGGFVKKIMSRCVRSVVLALAFTSLGFPAQVLAAVHAVFELSTPATSPFPSDWFTVPDASHDTRRRVNLPLPECVVRPSDCEDLNVVNTLDGFNADPRLSIPFDGLIDATTVTSETVFLVRLGITGRSFLASSRPCGRESSLLRAG
jgi:hypothetical protein